MTHDELHWGVEQFAVNAAIMEMHLLKPPLQSKYGPNGCFEVNSGSLQVHDG